MLSVATKKESEKLEGLKQRETDFIKTLFVIFAENSTQRKNIITCKSVFLCYAFVPATQPSHQATYKT